MNYLTNFVIKFPTENGIYFKNSRVEKIEIRDHKYIHTEIGIGYRFY